MFTVVLHLLIGPDGYGGLHDDDLCLAGFFATAGRARPGLDRFADVCRAASTYFRSAWPWSSQGVPTQMKITSAD